jgi:hypothetical protein
MGRLARDTDGGIPDWSDQSQAANICCGIARSDRLTQGKRRSTTKASGLPPALWVVPVVGRITAQSRGVGSVAWRMPAKQPSNRVDQSLQHGLIRFLWVGRAEARSPCLNPEP